MPPDRCVQAVARAGRGLGEGLGEFVPRASRPRFASPPLPARRERMYCGFPRFASSGSCSRSSFPMFLRAVPDRRS
jgi:hypothetical protein